MEDLSYWYDAPVSFWSLHRHMGQTLPEVNEETILGDKIKQPLPAPAWNHALQILV